MPLAALVAAFLLAAKQPRLAFVWCVAIAACAATIGALKLGLAVCGRPSIGIGLISPSGHAAMSMAVWGGIAALIATNPTRWLRWGSAVITVLLVAGIAASRLILHRHSPLEVFVGVTVGVGALLGVVVGIRRCQPRDLPIVQLILAAAIVALVFHGERWPAERAIHHFAGRFDPGSWCIRRL